MFGGFVKDKIKNHCSKRTPNVSREGGSREVLFIEPQFSPVPLMSPCPSCPLPPCPLPGLPCRLVGSLVILSKPFAALSVLLSAHPVPLFESAHEQEFVFCRVELFCCHHWQRELSHNTQSREKRLPRVFFIVKSVTFNPTSLHI